VNALVVTEFNHHVYTADQSKVFLTSLSITDVLAVLDLYDLRSLIEKHPVPRTQAGLVSGLLSQEDSGRCARHVFLTLTIFNLTMPIAPGRPRTCPARYRRQRREWQNGHQVIVFAGEFYAIFDLEEVFILIGGLPEICWRVNPAQVYRKYAADGFATARLMVQFQTGFYW